MKYNYSRHKIHREELCPFSEKEYSLFKFGDTFYAKKFASQLFDGFIDQFSSLILSKPEIVLLPSPYQAIPTASNFLCSYFKDRLNQFLFLNGKGACTEAKIHRKQTYTDDYGSLDFEQRIRLISNDTYYLDKQFIKDKFCIFLDDIRITGSHEKTVNKILDQYQVNGDFFFVYFAELINKEIHPSIENHYNYFALKSIDDIIALMNKGTFKFNTRIVKYILKLDERNFYAVVQHIAPGRRQELLHLAISNNYHQIKDYQVNIHKLNNKTSCQSTYKRANEKQLMPNNLSLA